MINKTALSLCCVASAVGVVVGYTVGRQTTPAREKIEVVEIAAPVITSANGDDLARLAQLTRQLGDANRTIASLNDQIEHLLGEDLPTPAVLDDVESEATPPRPERQRRENWEQRMERMQAEDPERYEQMRAQREEREHMRREFLEARRESEALRDDFFATVNIAYLSPEEQASLEAFIKDYQDLRGLFDPTQAGERPNMEQAAALGMRVLSQSNDIRVSLLKATAKEMGFDNQESVEFASAINDIFGATSIMGPGGGIPGMGRGGPRGRR